MRSYLIAFGVLFVSFCYSQPQTLQIVKNGSGISYFMDVHSEISDDTEGTPYIIPEFTNAKVDNGGQLFKIRYNGFLDEMEFEREGQIYSVDTNFHNEINFEGLNKVYKHFTEQGYLLQLFKGNKFVLYKKEQIEFKEKKKGATSFQQDIPAKYVRKKDIYFIELVDKSIIELPKSKSKIIELVKDKNEVNAYIKKNNLSLTEDSDLIVLFKYMDKVN